MTLIPFNILRRFRQFVAPILLVVRSLVPTYSRYLILVAAIGGGGSVLNVGGYMVLAPLFNHALHGGDIIAFGPFEFAATPTVFVSSLFIVLAFVVGATKLDFIVHSMALDIFHRTVKDAAVVGLKRLSNLSGDFKRRIAVKEVADSTAFACGFVMRQVAVGLADAIQLVVFLAVLLWLNTGLTLVFIVFVIVTGLLYARSLTAVVDTVTVNKEVSAKVRGEYNDLSAALEGGLSEAQLHERMEYLYSDGAIGTLLKGKLDIRREMKRGPMAMEYLFPVILVVVPLFVLSNGNLLEQAGQLVIYVLFLRNAVGLLKRLSSLFMTVGRFYPSLLCYADLSSCSHTPRCNFIYGPQQQAADHDDEY